MKDEAFGIVPIRRDADGDRFLLIQHLAGHWGFPKGHAEPDESALVAARREFEEETGIQDYDVLDHAFMERYSFTKSGETIEKSVTYFPAFVKSGDVSCQEDEIRDYAWVLYDDAIQKITFDQARQILIQVRTYLQETKQEINPNPGIV